MEPSFRTVPAALWAAVAPLLPPAPPKRRGGRPRVPARAVLAGILYWLRTGCQWKAMPSKFGSGSTCHLRMQWARAGVFPDAFAAMRRRYSHRRSGRCSSPSSARPSAWSACEIRRSARG